MKKAIFYFSPLALIVLAFVLVGPVSVGAVATTPVQPTKAPEILICPAGYICNPIPAQPVDCPAGYICSPIKTGEGSSSGGSNGSSPVISSCYTFTTNLTIGSMGADVVALQSLLISKGYSIPDISSGQVAKGYFGPSTANAVKAYQIANGISGTGFVGPLTRAALNALCTKDTVPSSMISVVSPNGGEVWTTGSKRSITWLSKGDIGNVNIRLLEGSEGLGGLYIASGVPNSGSYQFIVPNNLSGQYRVQISAVGGGVINDTSNGLFTINSDTISKSLITVKSPNGGEAYKTGDTVNINWQGGDSGARQISILPWSAMTNSNVSPVASITTSPGVNSYSWIIPTSVANGQYFVKIYCVGSCTSDSSDSYFTITSPTASVSSDLTVLTPVNPKNNTNIFSTGETLSLAWSSRYFGVNRIYLLSETGTQVATILATNDNGVFPYTGSTYSWKIPDNIPTGTYKVRVIIGINVQVADTGTFRIKNVSTVVTQPVVSVLYPSGGEVFSIGQKINARWNTGAGSGTEYVSLILRKTDTASNFPQDSGNQAVRVVNNGSYSWTISNIEVGQYVLRIACEPVSGCPVTDSKVFTITASTPIQNTSPTSMVDQSSLNASIWDAINEYYKSSR